MTIEDNQKEIIKIALARLKFNVEYGEKLLEENSELTEDEVKGTFAITMMDTLRGADALYDLARTPLDRILLKAGSIENYIELMDKCAKRFNDSVLENNHSITQNLAHLDDSRVPEDN